MRNELLILAGEDWQLAAKPCYDLIRVSPGLHLFVPRLLCGALCHPAGINGPKIRKVAHAGSSPYPKRNCAHARPDAFPIFLNVSSAVSFRVFG